MTVTIRKGWLVRYNSWHNYPIQDFDANSVVWKGEVSDRRAVRVAVQKAKKLAKEGWYKMLLASNDEIDNYLTGDTKRTLYVREGCQSKSARDGWYWREEYSGYQITIE